MNAIRRKHVACFGFYPTRRPSVVVFLNAESTKEQALKLGCLAYYGPGSNASSSGQDAECSSPFDAGMLGRCILVNATTPRRVSLVAIRKGMIWFTRACAKWNLAVVIQRRLPEQRYTSSAFACLGQGAAGATKNPLQCRTECPMVGGGGGGGGGGSRELGGGMISGRTACSSRKKSGRTAEVRQSVCQWPRGELKHKVRSGGRRGIPQ